MFSPTVTLTLASVFGTDRDCGARIRCHIFAPLERRFQRETLSQSNVEHPHGCLEHYCDISPHLRSVFHDTAMPDVAFSVVVQRGTRSWDTSHCFGPENQRFSFQGKGLFIRAEPTGSVIAGHWFILISRGEQFRWILSVTHSVFKTLVSTESLCCPLRLGFVSD